VPATARPGLLLLAAGLFADLLYHALSAALAIDPDVGYAAHVVVLLGMLGVLVGVVAAGLRAGHPTSRRSH